MKGMNMKSSKRTHTLPRLVAAFLTLTAFGVGTAHSCYFTDSGCGGGETITAYSDTGANSKFLSATKTIGATPTGYGEGYGVTTGSETSPDKYLLDNATNTELLAINFNSAVYLNTINFGYWGSDADFSVFAWVGAGSPSSAITGSSVNSLATSGWQLVGNYQDTGSNKVWDSTNSIWVSQVDVNNGGLVSGAAVPMSRTGGIISAYNSGYGGNSLGDNTSDYMKVLGVACATPTTPPGKISEPASLFMLGGGLIGMMAMRRRRQARN
jgi:hypothetical protein